MAPTKLTDRGSPTVVTNGATVPQRVSKLPSSLRVPIFIALSIFLRTSLYSAFASFTDNGLAQVSRVESDGWFVSAHFVYKVFLLWVGWVAKFDYVDVTSLAVITNLPYAYLLVTYYELALGTAAVFIGIESLSVAIPTYLLQVRSAIRNPRASVRNRFLLDSFQVQQSTTLLATGVYVTVIYAVLKTGVLNELLVSHFELPTLEGAHGETPLSIALKIFPAGLAAKEFLLNPSIGAQAGSGTITPVQPFDAATASLQETLTRNFWFFSKRTRVLIQQTATLSVFIFATTVQRILTIRDTDFPGAASYAGIWVVATAITAGWWTWVGDTEI